MIAHGLHMPVSGKHFGALIFTPRRQTSRSASLLRVYIEVLEIQDFDRTCFARFDYQIAEHLLGVRNLGPGGLTTIPQCGNVSGVFAHAAKSAMRIELKMELK